MPDGGKIMLLKTNYSMLTDFYEFTMSNGYLEQGVGDTIAYFDMFFRKVPDGGGYAIMAGVEQLVNYLKNLSLAASLSVFWIISKTSALSATSGLCPRAAPFSRANPS